MFVKGNNCNKGCIRPHATSVYDTWMLMELNETWFVDFLMHPCDINAYGTS